MKRVIGLLALVCCGFVAAQTEQKPLMSNGGPDAATRARLRAGMLARTGGMINRPDVEPGICFLNAQKTVPASAFEEKMQNIRDEFRVSCYLREGTFTDLASLGALAAKKQHACIVCVVDRPGFPQVLAAADNQWALVNIEPLKADKPSAEKLADRAAKVAWRGFGLAMGAGFSAQVGGLLQSARTLEELDAVYGRAVPPDCHFPMVNYIEKCKVARGGRTSYREACKEGWAPAPANDAQKKIWDEFHPNK